MNAAHVAWHNMFYWKASFIVKNVDEESILGELSTGKNKEIMGTAVLVTIQTVCIR